MTSSLVTVSIYAALLVAALLTPYAALFFGPRQARYWPPVWHIICAVLVVGAVVLTIARNGHVSLLCAFLLVPLVGLGMGAMLGGAVAIMLFVTVTWWTTDLQLSPLPAAIFAMLAIAAALLPRWGAPRTPDTPSPRLLWPLSLSMLIGLAAGLFTAPFEAIDPIYTAWHHWGAYLSPVEAWRGGGVPYRDFPIQYGLGPTALLRATCGDDCWSGLYRTAVVANALYFATLTGCVLILTAQSGRGMRWLALIAIFCASFIWTGYPIQFTGPAMTPSVAGLRFLAISALLFHILIAEQRKAPRDWIGHLIWLTSLFWSAEAGAFTSLIWWPYLALRDAGSATGGRGVMIALLCGMVRGVCALIAGIAALALALWLLSERSITFADFFAYILHPPGPMPINPVGTIWIALASIGLALPLLARQGLSAQGRSFYACLLGFLAAGTYYISRSHDNNILNLFPLLVLLLLAIFANREGGDDAAPGFVGGIVRTMLAAIVAFIAMFNFAPWQEGLAQAGPLTMGPARLVSQFTRQKDDDPTILPRDAIAGLDYLRARHAGAVLLFDDRKLMLREPGSRAWNGVNNIANYAPLPQSMIEHYIRRGALTYHRAGWIMADAHNRHWVKAFQTAYDIGERHDFGRYSAFYMVPR